MRINYVLRPRTQNNYQEFLTDQEARDIHHLARISRIFGKSKIGPFSNYKTFLQEIIRSVDFSSMLTTSHLQVDPFPNRDFSRKPGVSRAGDGEQDQKVNKMRKHKM